MPDHSRGQHMLPQQLPVQPQKNPPIPLTPRAAAPAAACVPGRSTGQHMPPQQPVGVHSSWPFFPRMCEEFKGASPARPQHARSARGDKKPPPTNQRGRVGRGKGLPNRHSTPWHPRPLFWPNNQSGTQSFPTAFCPAHRAPQKNGFSVGRSGGSRIGIGMQWRCFCAQLWRIFDSSGLFRIEVRVNDREELDDFLANFVGNFVGSHILDQGMALPFGPGSGIAA